MKIWFGDQFHPQQLSVEDERIFAAVARKRGMRTVALQMAPFQAKLILAFFIFGCIAAGIAEMLDHQRPLNSIGAIIQYVAIINVIWAVFQIPVLIINGILNFGRAYNYVADICKRH